MASVININIDQGATFALTIQMADEQGNLVDVSQYAFTAMMRQNYNRDPIIEFTVETVDAQLSKIEMSLTPTQTALLKAGTYVWDIIGLLPTGDVARIAEGQAEVLEGVTDYTFSTDNRVIARSAYVGRTVGNQVALNGFPGSYYLDYTNFTNVPTSIFDFGIVDGNSGEVLTTDGNGNVFFVPNTHDAVTFNGLPPSYYLSYTNLTDTPTQLQQFNVAGGVANSVLTDDGTGQWSFVDINTVIANATSNSAVTLNATELCGQPCSYYLDYTNFTNTPVIPTTVYDLGFPTGTNGQVLKTDGFGNLYFANENTNALTLAGKQPTFYLDYQNFSNVPTSIFDLGVVDGPAGTVLITDGSGNVGFAPAVTDAQTLNGLPGSYYLNYLNLVNRPTVATTPGGLTWDGNPGQVLKSDGAGGYYWDNLSVDADTLDGHDSTFFLNYNNLQNTPTVPQRLFDLLDVQDGNIGQFLMTYGNETVEFRDITLDGHNGQYYLDYNNFINTPSIPQSIFDMTDVYATVPTPGQVLTVINNGVYQFEDPNLDAETVDGRTLDQIMNYTNLSNKPFIPLRFLDLLDMQDGNPGQVLTTNGNGVIRFADPQGGTSGGGITSADALLLNGQPGSYYLDYNNFVNVPTLFSGDYNDLINKPVDQDTYLTNVLFTPADGNLTATRSDGTQFVTNFDGRYVESVNGLTPDVNGNVSVSLSATEVGTDAQRLASTPADNTVWIIANDPDTTKDGLTYIYSTTDSAWYQVSSFDMAAADARHIMRTDSIDALADVDTTSTSPVDGQVLIWDNATQNWIPGYGGGSTTFETESTVALAGQTIFNLAHVPMGEVHFARNGSTINDAAFTVSGQQVTYVPSANNNEVIDANDVITISYIWASSAAPVVTNVISDNADVNIAGVQDGDTLVWDNATSQFIPGASSGVGAIDDLTDVDTSSVAPLDGQVLTWNTATGQWYPAQPTAETILETDEVNVYSGTIDFGSAQVKEVMRLTLPSAGVYEVDFNVRSHHNASQWIRFWIGDTNQVNVDKGQNTWLSDYSTTGVTDLQGTTTGSAIVEVTQATTVVLWGYGAPAGNSGQIYADVNGGWKFKYKKLAGFLPYTSYLAPQHASYRPDITIFPGLPGPFHISLDTGNMPVVNATDVLLTAGVTYELRAQMNIRSGYAVYEWQNLSGTKISSVGISVAANSGDAASVSPAYAVYTPSVDEYVRVVLTADAQQGWGAFTGIDGTFGEISIKAISGQLPMDVAGHSITEHPDVTITGAQVGDLLQWNGSAWVNIPNPATQPGGLLQTVCYDLWDSASVNSNGATLGAARTEYIFDIIINPKSTNSKFIVTFDAEFRIGGTGADEYDTHLYETSTGATMRFVRQTSVTSTSEMGRSNTLLPITGFLPNTSLSPKTFRCQMNRQSGDDVMYVWNGIVMVQEVSN